jgi:hypothetical protein
LSAHPTPVGTSINPARIIPVLAEIKIRFGGFIFVFPSQMASRNRKTEAFPNSDSRKRCVWHYHGVALAKKTYGGKSLV